MSGSKKTKAKAVDKVQSSFNLQNFKNKKGLASTSVKFKQQDWIPLSEAFQEVTSIPGIPMGHITLVRGHSDTGKSTFLIEGAINAQKKKILPVFIITEMKWSWEHAREMGFQFTEKVNKDTGEIEDYEGFFLYRDRGTLNSIEDVAEFIADLLVEQEKGNLPYDLCFFWDSIGSIPCDLSIKSNKNNNEWNAGAMSTQFGNHINQKILLSRKESYPYINSMVAVNKVWTMKPESPVGSPKLMNKGGMAMWYDSSIVVTFGNITNPGTSKIRAVSKGKQVEFAKRTNVQIEKNHISGITTKGKIAMTQHGFIHATDEAINNYKKQHKDTWVALLGSKDFTIEEEDQSYEDVVESDTD